MSEQDFTERLADLLRRQIFRFIGAAGANGFMPSDATQTQFSRRIGVNKGTLSRILNGRNGPSYATLRKLVQSEEVGSEALAALGIVPDDPRIVRLLDQVIQGKLSPEQVEAAIARAHQYIPEDEDKPAFAEADPN